MTAADYGSNDIVWWLTSEVRSKAIVTCIPDAVGKKERSCVDNPGTVLFWKALNQHFVAVYSMTIGHCRTKSHALNG